MNQYRLGILLFVVCIIAPIVMGQKREPAKKLKPRTTPVLQLENGIVTSKIDGVIRPAGATICAGDKVSFAAVVTGTEEAEKQTVKWTASAKRKGEVIVLQNAGAVGLDKNFVLDTTGLEPGTYVITAETLAPYKDCEGGCTAYDSKTFVLGDCGSCFTSPSVTLTSATQLLNPGETVNICASQVTGGHNYGTLLPTWTSSAGKITGDASCAKLDTVGIAPGSSVTVNLNLKASDANCEANGTITFKVAEPVVVNAIELTPCSTFKTNNARVDNACKALLMDVARQLEADPQAQLVIDAYYRANEKSALAFERGKNVRDRLADGSIGVTVDANRLVVRPSGQVNNGNVVRLYLVPSGAKIPAGANAVNVGGVTKEARRSTNPARR